MILSIDLGKKFKVSNSILGWVYLKKKKFYMNFKQIEGGYHKCKKVAFELI